MKWRDTTSYSRDKERIPASWSLDIGGLHLTVVKNHIHHPGVWILQCDPWFREKELEYIKTAEEAQNAALELVQRKVDAAFSEFHPTV